MSPVEKASNGEDIPLVDVGATQGIAHTIIAVDGMTCGACTSAIENGFEGVDGVESFTVSLMTERAVVVHDLSKLTAEQAAEMYIFPKFMHCNSAEKLTAGYSESRIVDSMQKSSPAMSKYREVKRM
jgi:copper chaperone CopZ